MRDSLHTLAVNQLEALDDNVKLIAIHPNYVGQHLLLAEFMAADAVYVCFTGKKLSRNDLQEQLEQGVASQVGHDDLTRLPLLILDEVDRARPAEMDKFLTSLVDVLGNTRAVIFSRQIPQVMLKKESLREVSAFLPIDDAFMLWDYAHREQPTTLLEVRAFGEGRVLLNGKVVKNWDGVLPRSLFFYLVDRGMVTRNEIFKTFWPNLPVREATNVFHVTKRKISEVLGIDLTTYWSGFYRISPDIELSYDVVRFTDFVQQSAIMTDTTATIDLLHRADMLYRGDFLGGMDMDWVKQRRLELAQDYGESLAALAKVYEDSDQPYEALGLYLRAAAHNRNREDIVSRVMNLYYELGMYSDALKVYDHLTDGLSQELGVSPAPHIQALATSIRHEIEHTQHPAAT